MGQLVLLATTALALKIIRRKNHPNLLEMNQFSDETSSLNAHKRIKKEVQNLRRLTTEETQSILQIVTQKPWSILI